MDFKWRRLASRRQLIIFSSNITNMTNTVANTIITILIVVCVVFFAIFRLSTIAYINNNNNSDNKKLDKTLNLSLNDRNNDDNSNNNRLRVKKFKYHIPKFMLELYENNKFVNLTTAQTAIGQRPDIVRSLIPKRAETFSQIVGEWTDNHLLIFDLPTCDDDEQFVSAELKILTLIEIDADALNGVERQLKISVYDDWTNELYHLENIHIYHLNNTWLSFNLTEPVTEILQKQQHNKFLKIIISVTDFLSYYQSNNKFKLSLMPVNENYEHDYPVLLLSYNSNRKITNNNNNDNYRNLIRDKRSLEEDYEEETNHIWDDELSRKTQLKRYKRNRNTCRRRPLYINFSEIQYDLWIVQPQGYEAYQCQGKCFYPVAEHLNPTKHAIVQALLHSVAPMKVSRSCCVPTILDSISILYVDNNGVLTYRYAYKDMVVVECGCR